MKNNGKTMNPKVKLRLLQAGAFVTSITPLVVGVGVNWDAYVATSASQFSLAFGGIFAVVLMILKTFELLPKKPQRVVVAAVMFGLAYCLQALLADIVFLLGMYLIGELGEFAIFEHQIKKTKTRIEDEHNVGVMKNAVAQVLEESQKNADGRV